MQRLDISPDVLNRIRALSRQSGETEDQVLARLLDGAADRSGNAGVRIDGGNADVRIDGGNADVRIDGGNAAGGSDFIDTTYGVRFNDGDEIFRTYKGRFYSARVKGGRWVLDSDGRAADRRSYDSLNQLSQAVIDGNENAWMFWFTRRAGRPDVRIATLRDPALVQKRPRRRKGSTGRPAVAADSRTGMGQPVPPAAARVRAQARPPSPHPPTPIDSGLSEPAAGGMPWQPREP